MLFYSSEVVPSRQRAHKVGLSQCKSFEPRGMVAMKLVEGLDCRRLDCRQNNYNWNDDMEQWHWRSHLAWCRSRPKKKAVQGK